MHENGQWKWDDEDVPSDPYNASVWAQTVETPFCAALKFEEWLDEVFGDGFYDPANPDGWLQNLQATCENFQLDFSVCSRHLPTQPPMFCPPSDSSRAGVAEWSVVDDTFYLDLCQDKAMAQNVTYTITFDVTNSQQVQVSPSVSIVVGGTTTIPLMAVGKPGTPLRGIDGAADPLFITAPPGYLSTGSGACTLCFEGSWCPGGNLRNLCPPGSSSPPGSVAESACRCTNGFYRTGPSTCQSCPVGSYCFNETRYDCPPDTTSEVESWRLAQCECEPGKVGGPGTVPCAICPVNRYCEGGNQSDPCPDNSESNAGSSSKTQCRCRQSYFGSNGDTCTLCTAGGWCPGGTPVPNPCPDPPDSPPGSYESWQCQGRLDEKGISQSYPFYQCPENEPATPNEITIRIRSAGEITGSNPMPGRGFAITVTGLGEVGADGERVSVVSMVDEGAGNRALNGLVCDGNDQNVGRWVGDFPNSSLVLAMCNGQSLEADWIYSISLSVTNPQESQETPPVRIAITGSVTVPAIAMDKPGSGMLLAGIRGAADPLFVTVPPGYLSLAGDICVLCEEDHYCPGDNVSNMCPGNASSDPGSTAQSDCTCNLGFYGDPGGPCTLCPAGDYCPYGSSESEPCPFPRLSPAGSYESWQCQGRLDEKGISQSYPFYQCPENEPATPNEITIRIRSAGEITGSNPMPGRGFAITVTGLGEVGADGEAIAVFSEVVFPLSAREECPQTTSSTTTSMPPTSSSTSLAPTSTSSTTTSTPAPTTSSSSSSTALASSSSAAVTSPPSTTPAVSSTANGTFPPATTAAGAGNIRRAGAGEEGPCAIHGIFCDGLDRNVGRWRGAAGARELVLVLCDGETLRANTTYAITFSVTNPQASQEAPFVGVNITGSVTVPSIALDAPGNASQLAGISGAADPLFVTTPPGFTANPPDICELCAADHYCPGDNAVIPCPGNASSDPGSTAQPDCTCNLGFYGDPGGPCTLCPAGDYCPYGSAESEPCPFPRLSPAGSYESWQCQGRLDEKGISQSYPFYQCPENEPATPNEITIRIRSAGEITGSNPMPGRGFAITVTGLGEVGADGEAVRVVSSQDRGAGLQLSPGLLCSGNEQDVGRWRGSSTNQELELRICHGQVLVDGVVYVLTFNVTNPRVYQPSPAVRISITGNVTVPPTDLDKPGGGEALYNISGAADPLFVTVPPGFVSIGGEICEQCKANDWCPGNNLSLACPDHSTSPAGSARRADCMCDAGRFGYWCGLCTPGFWCPGGPDRFPCPEFTSSLAGSASEAECSVLLDLKLMSQGNPFYSCGSNASGRNELLLRIRSPSQSGDGSGASTAITITGLEEVGQNHGVVAVQGQNERSKEPITFCGGGGGGGAWRGDDLNRSLVLTMCANQTLEGNTTYSISFNVSNPRRAAESPSISIAITGSLSVPLVHVDKPGTDVNWEWSWIEGAADPLFVTVPPGYLSLAGDICVLCEEDHYCPGDNRSFACQPFSTSPAGSTSRDDCWCDLGRSGYWCELCRPGSWCPGGPDSRPCPATTNSSVGSSRPWECIGEFDVKVISQNNPFYSCGNFSGLNTLSLRLRSLGEITPDAGLEYGRDTAITITGLGGVASAGDVVAVEGRSELGDSSVKFCRGNDRNVGVWNGNAGTEVVQFAMCANERLKANETYLISFNVTNPKRVQDSPTVNISFTGSVTFPMVTLDKPGIDVNWEWSWIEGAADPLFVTVPPGYLSLAGDICVLCEENSYCPGDNITERCPFNASSDPGSSSVTDCTCNLGFYGGPGGPCTLCPAGDYCPYGSSESEPCPFPRLSPAGSYESWQCQGRLDEKGISQSYPFYQCPENEPATPNEITIRIRSAGEITGSNPMPGRGFAITVTGLGEVGADGERVSVVSMVDEGATNTTYKGEGNTTHNVASNRTLDALICDGNDQNVGRWDGQHLNRSLVLAMCNGQSLVRNTTYFITFNVSNPRRLTESPSISIAITGSVTVAFVVMDKPGTNVNWEWSWIEGAADPLFVTVPPGYLSLAGDICVLCEEDHYCPGDNVSNMCPGNASSDPGSTAQSDCTCNLGFYGDPGGPCTLCPAGDYCPYGSAESEPCPFPRLSPAGSYESWQCQGRLDEKGISQSYPFYQCPENEPATPNEITIRIRSAGEITGSNPMPGRGFAITVTGLGEVGADGERVSVVSMVDEGAGNRTLDALICDGNDQNVGRWDGPHFNRSLVLAMCNGQSLKADSAYSISFNVSNPRRLTESPSISIAITGSVTVAFVVMDKPGTNVNWEWSWIEGAADPLFVTVPPGYLSLAGDICVLCEEDHYCPGDNRSFACQPFSTSPAGSTSRDDCWCDEGRSGYWCELCRPGSWCPGGPDSRPCPATTNSSVGSSRPWECIGEFDVKVISQNNPFYSCGNFSGLNTLSLRLRSLGEITPDAGLEYGRDTAITITGLGEVASEGDTWPVYGHKIGTNEAIPFCEAGDRHVGLWGDALPNASNATLVFTMCDDARLEAAATYLISFNITNPQESQLSPAVSIAMTGSVTFPLMPVDKPGVDLDWEWSWIEGAADPLFVTVPPGYLSLAGDICVLCEEDHYCPGDNRSFACQPFSTSPAGSTSRDDCWCDLGRSGYWCELCRPGSWCPGGPDSRPCPATTNSSVGSSRPWDCIGEFDFRFISQNNPFYSCGTGMDAVSGLNTILVRLRTLAQITPDDGLKYGRPTGITITGLGGVASAGNIQLVRSQRDGGGAGITFCKDGARNLASWQGSISGSEALVLLLCDNDRIEANTTYSISFDINNPRRMQDSPVVSVSLTGSATFPAEPMGKPGADVDWEWSWIEGAADPLLVTVPPGYVSLAGDICVLCEENRYCPGDNHSYACPTQSTAPAGSTSREACWCNVGYFGYDCGLCTPGSWCPGGPDSRPCPAATNSSWGSSRPWDCIGEFDLKLLSQSNPFYSCGNVSGLNTLSLRLRSLAEITPDAGLEYGRATAITITGLGEVASAGQVVTVLGEKEGTNQRIAFCEGGDRNVGLWGTDAVSPALFLTMCDFETLEANQTYSISLEVANPQRSQDSPTINITMTGSATFPPEPMDKPGTDVDWEWSWIEGAADPLFVTVPPGYLSLAGDICVLCEENSYCPGDNHSFACPTQSTAPAGSTSREACWCNMGYSGFDCNLCAPGSWCPGGPNSYPCPASTDSQEGSSRPWDCIGEFDLKTIRQSNPFYSCDGDPGLNTLSLRLRSLAEITPDAGLEYGRATAITITGLGGVASDGETVLVRGQVEDSDERVFFCQGGERSNLGTWSGNPNNEALIISLCHNQSLAANVVYSITFDIANPRRIQNSPFVTVSLTGSISVRSVATDKPGTAVILDGQRGGADPLYVTTPPGYETAGQELCRLCEADHWCPGGSFKFECPELSTSPAGSSSRTACACPLGFGFSVEGPCVLAEPPTYEYLPLPSHPGWVLVNITAGRGAAYVNWTQLIDPSAASLLQPTCTATPGDQVSREVEAFVMDSSTLLAVSCFFATASLPSSAVLNVHPTPSLLVLYHFTGAARFGISESMLSFLKSVVASGLVVDVRRVVDWYGGASGLRRVTKVVSLRVLGRSCAEVLELYDIANATLQNHTSFLLRDEPEWADSALVRMEVFILDDSDPPCGREPPVITTPEPCDCGWWPFPWWLWLLIALVLLLPCVVAYFVWRCRRRPEVHVEVETKTPAPPPPKQPSTPKASSTVDFSSILLVLSRIEASIDQKGEWGEAEAIKIEDLIKGQDRTLEKIVEAGEVNADEVAEIKARLARMLALLDAKSPQEFSEIMLLLQNILALVSTLQFPAQAPPPARCTLREFADELERLVHAEWQREEERKRRRRRTGAHRDRNHLPPLARSPREEGGAGAGRRSLEAMAKEIAKGLLEEWKRQRGANGRGAREGAALEAWTDEAPWTWLEGRVRLEWRKPLDAPAGTPPELVLVELEEHDPHFDQGAPSGPWRRLATASTLNPGDPPPVQPPDTTPPVGVPRVGVPLDPGPPDPQTPTRASPTLPPSPEQEEKEPDAAATSLQQKPPTVGMRPQAPPPPPVAAVPPPPSSLRPKREPSLAELLAVGADTDPDPSYRYLARPILKFLRFW